MLDNNNASANATETQINWKSLHTSGCSHQCAFVDLKCGRGNAVLKTVDVTYRSNSLPTCVPSKQKCYISLQLCSSRPAMVADVSIRLLPCLPSAKRLVWQSAKASCCTLSSRRVCTASSRSPAAHSATRTRIECPATACHLSVERPSSGMGCSQALVTSNCCTNEKSMTDA